MRVLALLLLMAIPTQGVFGADAPQAPEETYVIMTARDLDRLVRAFNAALAELERAKKRPAAHCS